MRAVFFFFVFAGVVVVAAACSVDLKPEQKAAGALFPELASTSEMQHHLAEKIDRHVVGLPNVAPDDVTGAGLRRAVDAAVAEHKAALAALDAVAPAARGAFDAAVAAEDKDGAAAVLDDARQKHERGKREVADKSNVAIRAIEALRSHIEAEKARANEDVRRRAEVEAADERVLHKGGELGFDVAFKEDVVAEDDAFARLLTFAKRCEALRFELIGYGEHAKARAESVRVALEKNKARNRVTKISAREGDGGVAVVVQKPCPEGGYVDD